MRDVTNANFGLAIAYLLPGFVAVVGISFLSATVQAWLIVPSLDAGRVGGFVYVTLGSLAAGLTVSTVRWATVDWIHHRTGVREPEWNDAVLQANVTAFQYLVENHYRYYQFHSNAFVAIAFAVVAFHIARGWQSVWFVAGILVVESILWMGSRDTLHRYYARTEAVLGRRLDRDLKTENTKRLAVSFKPKTDGAPEIEIED